MLAPLIRIALRVIAGILLGKGWFTPEQAQFMADDPDLAPLIEIALGGAILFITECWYWLANRLGWAT